ncbi:acetyl-carboxylase [Blastocystis sp. subtype 4]|uniref:acetyl-carboxylase n=1 Tax=Blastocystis sp. subtype 4 TaxID=944170 RepID=UPI000711AAAB|nr:acetyl-carboxylase [Blastocystis sp. subtype 4]KNB41610.1 acetyl-carboxylase [Blastocystis sp. subtype 4]|eukprot:XP_014525053.1 acetyl-carboxylase [Blastocystis sp. subtype 4]
MIKAGIKPENITYLTYYSDVYKDVNPFKGIVFTNPADNKDSDWAKVFLAILSGDTETVKANTGKENPKVLAAGPNDPVSPVSLIMVQKVSLLLVRIMSLKNNCLIP